MRNSNRSTDLERGRKGIQLKQVREESNEERLFRLLVENADDVLFIYQYIPEERWLYVSPSSLAVVGITPEEYYDDAFIGAKRVHPDDLPIFQEWLKTFTQDNRPLIVRYIHQDGTIKWTEERTCVVHDGEGNVEAAVGIIRDITEQKVAEEKLLQSRNQLRQMSKHLQDIRETERARIAREIHDELGAWLTALKISFSRLVRRIPEEQELIQRTESISSMINNVIQKIKEISEDLRPSLLDDFGISAAIEWLASNFERESGIDCRTSIIPYDAVYSKDLSTALYRIAQEALTNVTRHANATNVWITLKSNASRIRMSIVDNGKGISRAQVSNQQSFGLLGIKERVSALGGRSQIVGKRNKGTAVVVNIPLNH